MPRKTTLTLFFALVTMFATSATAQLITESVSASDVELFQFDTPTGGANKIIVAKFVTEDPSPTDPMDPSDPLDNLRFELETEVLAGSSSDVSDKPFKISDANVEALDINNVQVVQLRAQETAESAPLGYRILKIRVRFQFGFDFSTAETWAIRAKSLASGTVHFWGFEEEGLDEATVEATATRPHLIEYIEDGSGDPDVTNFGAFIDLPASKNLVFGTAHVNSSDAFAISQPYDFINVGTAPLEIIGVAETSGGSNVNLPVSGYSAVGYFTTPSTILPLAAKTGTVFKFNPTATGAASDVNIDLTINSASIPLLEVNLVGGHGIRLKTGLLVDMSGSMNNDVHGNISVDSDGKPTNQESIRKMYKARDAARYFVDVYMQNVPEAEIGLVTYPGSAGGCSNSEQVVNYDEVQDGSTFLALHDQRLSRNDPLRIRPEDSSFLTPMTNGLQTMLDGMPNSGADTKRIVFMVGDGQNYCGSGVSPSPSTLQSSLSSSGIVFHTVPYGDDQAAWTQQLKDIADWTGGDSFPVNLDDEDDLKKEAENVLREVIGLETLTDPGGTIQRDQIIRDKVCVPEDEYVLNFLVRWENEEVGALSVAIEAPDGTRIDKSTAVSQPADVGYFESESFIGLTVRGSILAGRNGVGDWFIELRGTNAIDQADSVEFDYSVYSQSNLKSGFVFAPWHVGRVSEVELFIQSIDRPIRGFDFATLQYRAPTQGFGTWLATTPADPELVVKVPDDAPGSPISMADKKYWLLTNELGKPFDPKWVNQEVELAGPSAPIRNTAVVTQPGASKGSLLSGKLLEASAAGRYEFTGKMQGLNIRGDCFQREVSWVQDVRIGFTPELLLKNIAIVPIEITPLFPERLAKILREEPPEGMIRSAVRILLKDDRGNYAGPGYGDRIDLVVTGGSLLESYTDNLDGSFTYIVQHDTASDPELKVTVDRVAAGPVKISKLPGSEPDYLWVWIVLLLIVLALIVGFLIWKSA